MHRVKQGLMVAWFLQSGCMPLDPIQEWEVFEARVGDCTVRAIVLRAGEKDKGKYAFAPDVEFTGKSAARVLFEPGDYSPSSYRVTRFEEGGTSASGCFKRVNVSKRRPSVTELERVGSD